MRRLELTIKDKKYMKKNHILSRILAVYVTLVLIGPLLPPTEGGLHVHCQRLRVGRLHPEVRTPTLTLLLPRQLHLVLRGPRGRPLPFLLRLPVLRGLPERPRPGSTVSGRGGVQRSLWRVRTRTVAYLRAAHQANH